MHTRGANKFFFTPAAEVHQVTHLFIILTGSESKIDFGVRKVIFKAREQQIKRLFTGIPASVCALHAIRDVRKKRGDTQFFMVVHMEQTGKNGALYSEEQISSNTHSS
jgi:hypothetical protein